MGQASEFRVRRTLLLIFIAILTLGTAYAFEGDGLSNANYTDLDYLSFCPRAIADSCLAGNTSLSCKTLKQNIIQGWYQCWTNIEESAGGPGPVLRVLLPDIYEDWLVPTLHRFGRLHNITIQLDIEPIGRLLDTIINDAFLPPPRQHAVWLQTTLTTQHLADIGLSLDLSHLVEFPSSAELLWSDIYQLFRLQLASYRGRIVSMPLDGSTMYLIHRADVLGRLGLQVPRTWQGVLDYAAAYTRARDAAVAEEAAAAAGAAEGQQEQERGASGSANATQLPLYPLCIPRGAACRRLTLLQAIWSTIAQTHGSQQGVHFDPATLEPLLDTPAAAEAFRVVAGLLAAAAPEEAGEGCSHGSLSFARGRCALVLAVFVPQMRMLVRPEFNATVVMSSLGVSPVPGSDLVWTRGSVAGGVSGQGRSQLQPCNAERCPMGTRYDNAEGGTTLVNHAPLSPGSNLAGAVNRGLPLVTQYLSFQLLLFLASLDRYAPLEAELQPEPLLQTVAPVREHLVVSDAVDVWVQAGYDRRMMTEAMAPIAFTRAHPNRAWDLRMPYHMYYNDVLAGILEGLETGNVVLGEQLQVAQGSAAAINGTATPAPAVGVSPDQRRRWRRRQRRRRLLQQQEHDGASAPSPSAPAHVSPPPPQATPSPSPSPPAGGAARFRSLSAALRDGQQLLAAYYDPEVYREKYLASLAFTAPPASPVGPSAAAATAARGVSAQTLVPALLVSTLALAGAAAGGGVVWWRRSRRRRSRGGARDWQRRHKGGGGGGWEPVALVVTDIEGSTALWEALPAALMSEVIRLHHTCVRKLLRSHGGYESATEGDSFILAFLTAKQAVAFALELQAQLLVLPWPEELLEQPACAVVSVDLPEGFPFVGRPGLSLALSERGLRHGAGSGTFRNRRTTCGPTDESGGARSRPASGHRGCPVSSSAFAAAVTAAPGVGKTSPLALASASASRLPRWLCTRTTSSQSVGVAAAAAAAQGDSPLSSPPTGGIGGGGGGVTPPHAMSAAAAVLHGVPVLTADGTGLGPRGGGGEIVVQPTNGRASFAGFVSSGGSGGSVRQTRVASVCHSLLPLEAAPGARASIDVAASGELDGVAGAPRRRARTAYDHEFVRQALPLGGGLPAAVSVSTTGTATAVDAVDCENEYEDDVLAGTAVTAAAAPPPPSPPLQHPQASEQRLLRPLAPSTAAAAAALAARWRMLDSMPPAAAMTTTLRTSLDTAETQTDDGDGDGEQRALFGSPGQAALLGLGLGPAASACGRQRLNVAFASLTDKGAESGERPSGIGGGGAAAASAAAGLASGRSRGGPGINGPVPGEPSQTLGQLLSKAAAAVAAAAAAAPPPQSASRGGGGGGLLRSCPSVPAPAMAAAGPPSAAETAAVAGSGPSPVPVSAAAVHKATAAGLIFRGLRVRVGISWVLPSAGELQYNVAAARMVYGGPCVAAAKAVADMGHGGQVLLSGAAKEQLEAECCAGGSGRPGGTMMLHMGTFALQRPPSGGQRTSGLLGAALERQKSVAAANAAAAANAFAYATTGSLSGLMSSSGAGNAAAAAPPLPPPPPLSPDGAPGSSPLLMSSGPLLYSTDGSQRLWKGLSGGSAAAAAAAKPAFEKRCVFWATSPGLSPRLALLPPLRLPPDATPLCDVYNAPTGRVSYVAVQIPAVAALLAWNRGVTEEALRVLHEAATAQMQSVSAYGTGYKAPCAGGAERGRLCAVFTTASAAVRWAEGLRRELLAAPWPPELLEHEFCEVVETCSAAMDPWVSGPKKYTKRTRRGSLNACLYPEAAAASVTAAASGAVGAVGVGGIGSSFRLGASSSSQQPQLWSTAPAAAVAAAAAAAPGSSNVNRYHKRSNGDAGGDSNDGGSTSRQELMGANMRAASGGLAAFLMLRRLEGRSRRGGISQKGSTFASAAAAVAPAAAVAAAAADSLVAGMEDLTSTSPPTASASATDGGGGGGGEAGGCIHRYFASAGGTASLRQPSRKPGAPQEAAFHRLASNASSGNGGGGGDNQLPALLPADPSPVVAASAVEDQPACEGFANPVGRLPPCAGATRSGGSSAHGGALLGGGPTTDATCPPSPSMAAAAAAVAATPPPLALPDYLAGPARLELAPEAASMRRSLDATAAWLDAPPLAHRPLSSRVRPWLAWGPAAATCGAPRLPRVSTAATLARETVPGLSGDTGGSGSRSQSTAQVNACTSSAAAAPAAEHLAGRGVGGGAGRGSGGVDRGSVDVSRCGDEISCTDTGSLTNVGPVVLLRGLRMRAGIATGTADWSIQDHTHALGYTGRPVAAATKLAAAAACGQVLCEEMTRNEAVAEQLWALSLEEEEEEKEEEDVGQGSGGGGGGRGRGRGPGPGGAAVAAAAAAEGARRRQQLLMFTRAEDGAPASRRRGLARAYVCRMFDRGSAPDGRSAAEPTEDGTPPPPAAAAAAPPLPPLPPRAPSPRPPPKGRAAPRALCDRRASTLDGHVAATATAAAAAVGTGGARNACRLSLESGHRGGGSGGGGSGGGGGSAARPRPNTGNIHIHDVYGMSSSVSLGARLH